MVCHKDVFKNLELYRKFLENIPLDKFREEYIKVKWVEQDLPKEILPLASIFRNYWDEMNLLDFEDWFENFWGELHQNEERLLALKNFKKYYFDKNNDGWFKLGFKARMYRTWVSVLTQLDFCYVFVYVSDKQNKNLKLEANAELDRKGIDARVGDIDFQVAKISQRKEARPGVSGKKKKITIPYAVFNINEFKRKSRSSSVKQDNRRKYKKAIEAFFKYFKILPNGFVVFNEYYVSEIVKNIHDAQALKVIVDKILLELSGEY